MDVRLWDGREGQACVTGRDDDVWLALLEPLFGPAGAYDHLALSTESPSLGQRLDLFEYTPAEPALSRRETKVVWLEPPGDDYGYMRIEAADYTIAGGAVLVSEGRVAGMRMPLLVNYDCCGSRHPGEELAIDASVLTNAVLSALRSGWVHMLPVLPSPDVYSPPWIPIVFNGEISIDGAPAPVGTRVHAKVSKEGEPDYWKSAPIGVAGEYVLPLPGESSYLGGTVEFWADCRRFPTAIAYEHLTGSAVELDLAF